MKVLVTGFEPFGGEDINPSFEAVKRLDSSICGANIIKAEIPVVFNKALAVLKNLIKAEEPNIVICVGQAGGRYNICLERVAINVDDARIEDNEGNKPVDTPIIEDGQNAYFSSLPIKDIVESLKDVNIPAAISNSAGTYVCNHIMYGLLHSIEKEYRDMKGGFIHVPYLPYQVLNKQNMPYMELEKITEALKIAIEVSIERF